MLLLSICGFHTPSVALVPMNFPLCVPYDKTSVGIV